MVLIERAVTTTAPKRLPDSQKHYASDPMKEKVHALLGDMLDSTLLTFRKPGEIKVLHFAGIDAAETQRVYLSRGIPAGNITTLERSPQVAEQIRKLGLGINVITKSLQEYVKEEVAQGRKFDFDVLSMDFTGPPNAEDLLTVRAIMDNSKKNHILLHSANLLKRDANSLILYHQGAAEYEYIMRLDDAIELPAGIMPTAGATLIGHDAVCTSLNAFDNEFANSEKTTRKDLKAFYYPYLILNLAKPPFRFSYFYDMIKFVGDVTGANAENNGPVRRISKRDASMKEFLAPEDFVEYAKEHLTAAQKMVAAIDQFVSERVGNTLKAYNKDSNIIKYAIIGAINEALLDRIYVPLKEANYSYISESGSPMVGSMFFFSWSRLLHEAYMDVAKACGFPEGFRIEDTERLGKAIVALGKMLSKKEKLDEKYETAPLSATLEPRFLGNSSKPVLSKGRFLEELEKTDLEGPEFLAYIKDKYRGWGKRPLAQWKAHYTMGTYGKGRAHGESAIEVFDEDSDIEKITKEEVYDLLASGIPPKEIYDAYPTSFSVSQLRAFRAWITMRDVKRE